VVARAIMHKRKAFAVRRGFVEMIKAGWPVCKKVKGKEIYMPGYQHKWK